jgi:hypothetical protein
MPRVLVKVVGLPRRTSRCSIRTPSPNSMQAFVEALGVADKGRCKLLSRRGRPTTRCKSWRTRETVAGSFTQPSTPYSPFGRRPPPSSSQSLGSSPSASEPAPSQRSSDLPQEVRLPPNIVSTLNPPLRSFPQKRTFLFGVDMGVSSARVAQKARNAFQAKYILSYVAACIPDRGQLK